MKYQLGSDLNSISKILRHSVVSKAIKQSTYSRKGCPVLVKQLEKTILPATKQEKRRNPINWVLEPSYEAPNGNAKCSFYQLFVVWMLMINIFIYLKG